MRRITLSPFALTLCVSSLAAGCASLEQAPLTYSSVNTMGLSIAAATPQQPGLDVTIGYKGADVAYTPVAVAKKCGSNESKLCYEIVPVFGTSDGVAKSNNSKAYDEAVHNFQDARKKREVAEFAFREESSNYLKAENECQLAKSSSTALPDSTEVTVKQQAIEQADAKCAIFDGLKNGRTEKLTALNASIDAATKQERNAEAEVGRQAAESSIGNNSRDSYSVFGTFNGNATADSSGGVLQLGKTFSTGVAAQRYSEGLKTAAATIAMKQCVDAVTAMLIAGKATGDETIKQAMSLCSSRLDTQHP